MDLKSLASVVWPQMVQTFPGIFLQLCGMVLGSFVVPLMSAKVLDIRGENESNDKLGMINWTLLYGVVIILSLQLIGSGLRALERLFLEGRCQKARSQVEGMLFQHLIRLDATFYSKSQIGELLAALSNPGVTYFCAEFLPNAIKGLTALLGGAIAMVFTQRTLAMVAMMTAPILFLIQKIRARKSRRAARRIDAARAHAHALAAESLRAASTVQVHAAEAIEILRFNQALDVTIQAAYQAAADDVLIASSADACVAINDAIFLYFAASCVARGEVSIGQFAAFRSALSQYQRGLRELTKTANKLALSYGQASRFLSLLFQTKSALPDNGLRSCQQEHAPELRLDRVFFRYTAAAHTPFVLTNCSLIARAGETTALCGSSGSGKTTVGKLLLRLYDPQRGCVLADNISLPQFLLSEHRRRFGVVNQEPSLFNRSVFANIAYGLPQQNNLKQRVIAAAQRAAVHNVILALPYGYDTVLGEGGSTISGGERQRLALARAVVRDPRCLLLDEATSSLDVVSERLVQDALEACHYKCTTVVIAHRLSTIVAADAIIVMDHGSVVERGTHAQLVANPNGVYAGMYRTYITDRASLNDATSSNSAIGTASRSHPLLSALDDQSDSGFQHTQSYDSTGGKESPYLSSAATAGQTSPRHLESSSSSDYEEDEDGD